jgi:ubiquinone/menaquinone biosynthesis C-methylase UbiE
MHAAYWEKRAKDLGPKAVAHLGWTHTRYIEATEQWWQRLDPGPGAGTLLDFGCGVGRFALRLALNGWHVIGVDISPEMLRMAEKLSRVQREEGLSLRFELLAPGQPLPYPDGFFNGLFIATVLQHVRDENFSTTVQDICRMLKPGASLCLCENTAHMKDRMSHSGHITFRSQREYLEAFPGLDVVESWDVEGEQHTVFRGRLCKER